MQGSFFFPFRWCGRMPYDAIQCNDIVDVCQNHSPTILRFPNTLQNTQINVVFRSEINESLYFIIRELQFHVLVCNPKTYAISHVNGSSQSFSNVCKRKKEQDEKKKPNATNRLLVKMSFLFLMISSQKKPE